MFRRVYPCLSCRRGIRAPSCTRCAITLAWHIPVIVVRFGRHGTFYLWQVWWSAQAGRKGRHELCSSQPYKPPTNHPARPLMQNFFRCAGQIATPCGARYPSWGEARRKSRQVRTKVQKHAARRGGSGTQGAVAQFSTGRRCDVSVCAVRVSGQHLQIYTPFLERTVEYCK